MPVNNQLREQLRKEVESAFILSELEVLCFSLGIPWDDVKKEEKANAIIHIITYADRHNLLPKFIAKCKDERPAGNWPVIAPKLHIPFTNRTRELKRLLRKIDKESPQDNKYFIVHAPAGYGKSIILEKVNEEFDAEEWTCCYAKVEQDDSLLQVARLLSADLGTPLSDTDTTVERLGGAIQKKFDDETPPGKGLAVIIDLDKKPSETLLQQLLDEFVPDLAVCRRSRIFSIETILV